MRPEICKNVITLLFLAGTFIVTAATSKGGQRLPKFSQSFTNYEVTSNCDDAIEHAIIRVNRSEIIESDYASNQGGTQAGQTNQLRHFDQFGFTALFLNVGQDDLGGEANSKRDCKVHETLVKPNDDYDKSLTQYHFAAPGYFTSTIYDCTDNEVYQCTIVFNELEAVEFEEL